MSDACATARTPCWSRTDRQSASASAWRLRYPMTTLTPCSASNVAVAAPMPREPPVISARLPRNPFIVCSQAALHVLADEMFNAQVQFLRAIGARRWNDNRVIGQRAQAATVTRAERQHRDALRPGRFCGPQHVRRIAARRVDDQEVARSRQRFHLAREDVIEPEIVAGG